MGVASNRECSKKLARLGVSSTPPPSTTLCSDHFTPECFEIDSLLAQSMGLEKRRKLKPDAVPSIFKRHTAGEGVKEGRM